MLTKQWWKKNGQLQYQAIFGKPKIPVQTSHFIIWVLITHFKICIKSYHIMTVTVTLPMPNYDVFTGNLQPHTYIYMWKKELELNAILFKST